ncbi:MAG TPA: EAL domain-containing protein [Chloroflexota bacterium]|nr:EAL domain-containing protein [Chloroflexota bacterium]
MTTVVGSSRRETRLAATVLWSTVVGGLAAVAVGLLALYQYGTWTDVLPFVALAVLADLLTVDLVDSQTERFTFSLSIAVMLTAVVIHPATAPLVGLAEAAVHVARSKTRRVDKVLFNLANVPLAVGAASGTYVLTNPALGGSGIGELLAGACAVVAFYVTNSLGISIMISISARRSLLEVVREQGWSAPISICLGLTGAFVGSGYGQLGTVGTAMFVVPLGVLRFTLQIFARKSRQTITTLRQLNTQLSDEVTQRSAAEAALGESEAQLRAVLDNVAEGILTVDEGGFIQTSNPAAEQVFGFPAAELAGQHLGALVPMLRSSGSAGSNAFSRLLTQIRIGVGPLETIGRRRDEGVFPIDVAIGEMHQEAIGYVVSVRDITERKQAQAALEHQAVHDALTGLPNRLLLQDRLSQAILSARRDETPLALLVMDLDRFKEVNDTLGHHYGDLLLRELGVRLRGLLGEADTAARLGGDEFAMLLPMASAEEAEVAARRVLKALQEPFVVDGHPVEIGGSIGVAVFPDHGSDPGTLLRRADVAMYVAKRSQSEYSLYAPEHDQHSPDRLSLASELRVAIEQGQLELFYQPKADFASGRIYGVEALVRWRHPQRGLVAPDEFIPLAEQSGLVRALSRWVLNAALCQARAWADAGKSLSIAINLSMRDLQDPSLPEMIATALLQWGVPPALLAVEITESTLMADPAQAMEIVRAISAMGVRIAIDDFGTGYSSLAYLKRLAVNELKVDRSFVRHVVTDSHDVAIVRSTISLAHELGLEVVAEGIEDEPTWELLTRLGCDTAQGFFISKALPVAEFERWCVESGWRIDGTDQPDGLRLVA